MPNRMWWHLCGDTEVLEGARRCSLCGAEGTFDGWRLSLWEAARVYHYVYGLNPFGPHRPHADLVLGSMRETCLRCGGRAVLTVDPETWCDCPTCEGTGGVWNRPFAEVDAVWRDVVARWPGAALPWVDARTRRAAPAADEPPPEASEEPTPNAATTDAPAQAQPDSTPSAARASALSQRAAAMRIDPMALMMECITRGPGCAAVTAPRAGHYQ